MGKNYLDIDVLEASMERIGYLYNEFLPAEIWLSFSGGKDSTVCFYLMKQEALSRGIKFINILIIDLEAHYKLHSDFIDEIINDKDIEVRGYHICLPFNLSNASSFYAPKWLCWDKEEQDKWVRPLPSNKLVITEENNPFEEYFRKGMEFEEFIIEFPKYLIKERGLNKVGQIIGIRTQESYNRYLKMKVQKHREFYNEKQWILKQKSTNQDTYSVHPIYDWNVEDVWKYLGKYKYTKVYDLMYLSGCSLNSMRICQPYGEEQRDNIDLFAKIEPETWEKVNSRLEGGNFAKIYKGKNVYKNNIKKPENISWENWARLILRTMPPYLSEHYLRRINVFLRWWRKEIYNDIPSVYSKEYQDNEKLDNEGIYVVDIHDEHIDDTKKMQPSWRRIAKVLVKGDYLCKNLTFSMNKKEYEKLEELKEKWENKI